MKTIYLNHSLSNRHISEILSHEDFSAPNSVLPEMKKALYPGAEIFASVNHWAETERFMQKNIISESIRQMEAADGFITDQVFEDHHHHLDLKFISELSKQIGNKHFIIGSTFSKVPAFLQSRLLDELVEYDVSGIMYDVRELDMDDHSALQPLARLKIHSKKRIVIIPHVRDEAQLKTLVNRVPFDVASVDQF